MAPCWLDNIVCKALVEAKSFDTSIEILGEDAEDGPEFEELAVEAGVLLFPITDFLLCGFWDETTD